MTNFDDLFDNDPQTRYERVMETGYADFEDLEYSLSIHRVRQWCSACERESIWRDHLEAAGLPVDELACLGCLGRTQWWLKKDSE